MTNAPKRQTPGTIERIVKKLSPPTTRAEFESAANTWRELQHNTPCWIILGQAPSPTTWYRKPSKHPLISHNGKPTPAGRPVMEYLIGRPLEPGWQVRRICGTSNCVRPNHLKITTTLWATTMPDSLARVEEEPEDALEECIDMILLTGMRWQTADAILHERPDWDYSKDLVTQALHDIKLKDL